MFQVRLADAEKDLEEADKAFQTRIFEIDQEKVRTIEAHDQLVAQHRNRAAIMRADPAFRTAEELASLTEEVAKCTTATLTLKGPEETQKEQEKSKTREEECPVCLEVFQSQVFSCPGCDGLFCCGCVGRLSRCMNALLSAAFGAFQEMTFRQKSFYIYGMRTA